MNTNTVESKKRPFNPLWWLLAGVALTTLTHLTHGIGILAWVSNVPFLMYLSQTQGRKSRLLFILALITAWSFATAKIITPPMTYLMVFLFSIPLALFQLPAYLLWSAFRNRPYAFFIFPAVLVVMEWVQYTFTPFASWGIAAYTQMDNLILMQSVSLAGVAGLGFIIYSVNVVIAESWIHGKVPMKNAIAMLGIIVCCYVFGSLRYSLSKYAGRETIKVAAVGTDSKVAGLPLPPIEVAMKDRAMLFARTQKAAEAGAKIVVWNEAAIGIEKRNELAWKDSLSTLAKMLNIHLVAAYVMPVSVDPLVYENKYVTVLPDGNISYTYLKHQPVPGEPAVKGHEEMKFMNVNGIRVGGSICYDYDFPYMAKAWGKLDADIVTVPSSDWRGIDPIHTKMAAFRAVEQGHSIVRSTRFGLSAAITPVGEMVMQQSSFDSHDKIMLADVPVKGMRTLYSIIGDSFVFLCLAFTGFFLIKIYLDKRQ